MKKIFIYALLIVCVCFNQAHSQSSEHVIFETTNYKIDFPSQFLKSEQTLPSGLGEIVMTIISYEPSGPSKDSNYVYMLMDSDYPDSTIHSDKTEMLDEFFKASIDGAVKKANGKLMKENKLLTGGYPSRLIEIDYENGLAVITMKMILIRNKMVIIQTITNPKNHPNLQATNFINSFALK